jgi:hypothetical protein
LPGAPAVTQNLRLTLPRMLQSRKYYVQVSLHVRGVVNFVKVKTMPSDVILQSGASPSGLLRLSVGVGVIGGESTGWRETFPGHDWHRDSGTDVDTLLYPSVIPTGSSSYSPCNSSSSHTFVLVSHHNVHRTPRYPRSRRQRRRCSCSRRVKLLRRQLIWRQRGLDQPYCDLPQPSEQLRCA